MNPWMRLGRGHVSPLTSLSAAMSLCWDIWDGRLRGGEIQEGNRSPAKAGGCIPRHIQQNTEPKVPPPHARDGAFPFSPQCRRLGWILHSNIVTHPISVPPFPLSLTCTHLQRTIVQQFHGRATPTLASPQPQIPLPASGKHRRIIPVGKGHRHHPVRSHDWGR